MSVLNIKTQDQLLFIVRPEPIITSGNRNNDMVRVTFDETWRCKDGKFFASFYIDNPDEAYKRELLPESDMCFSCLIPNEVLVKAGTFKIGVWCEFDDKLKTSSNKEVQVHQGAVTNSNPPTDTENNGNSGGNTSGNTGGNIDLSSYAKKSEIPKKTSQLTNDSGFITAKDIPTMPTKTSELENNSGFITLEDIPEIDTLEIAYQAANLIDTSLLSAIGTGVLE